MRFLGGDKPRPVASFTELNSDDADQLELIQVEYYMPEVEEDEGKEEPEDDAVTALFSDHSYDYDETEGIPIFYSYNKTLLSTHPEDHPDQPLLFES